MEVSGKKKSAAVFSVLRNYFEYFIFYAFVGWVFEVSLCAVLDERGFLNRGFFFGPWLPIYGLAMILVLLTVKVSKADSPLKVFFAGVITVTLAELAASYVMEWIMHARLWTYHEEFLNFDGRIALRPALYFGVLSLIGVYFVHPRVVRFLDKYNKSALFNAFVALIFLLFSADVIARFFLGSNFVDPIA